MHLGLIGFGSIAQGVLDGVRRPGAPEVDRVTVLVRPGRAAETLEAAGSGIAVVEVLDDLLAAAPDLVAECAGAGAVRDMVPGLLRAGVDVIAVSIGALADDAVHATLRDAARQGRAKLILPAGAVGGIDILGALTQGGAVTVQYRGVKPPAAWAGTPAEDLLDLARLTEATAFFTGTAREAATHYPKNANVAATLALAGAGLDATSVELIADPAAPGNRHSFTVHSDAGNVTVQIDNKASAGNARTSQATIYSVLRAIGHHAGPVVI